MQTVFAATRSVLVCVRLSIDRSVFLFLFWSLGLQNMVCLLCRVLLFSIYASLFIANYIGANRLLSIQSTSFSLSFCFSILSLLLANALSVLHWDGALTEQHPGPVHPAASHRLLHQGKLQPRRPEFRHGDGAAGDTGQKEHFSVRRFEGHGLHPQKQAGAQLFQVSNGPPPPPPCRYPISLYNGSVSIFDLYCVRACTLVFNKS